MFTIDYAPEYVDVSDEHVIEVAYHGPMNTYSVLTTETYATEACQHMLNQAAQDAEDVMWLRQMDQREDDAAISGSILTMDRLGFFSDGEVMI